MYFYTHTQLVSQKLAKCVPSLKCLKYHETQTVKNVEVTKGGKLEDR